MAEAEYCQRLGKAAPEIVVVGPDYYVMEYLEREAETPGLLRRIEQTLVEHVWSQWINGDPDSWVVPFVERMGFAPPDWVSDALLCRTHGDCTVSNAMLRNGQTVVCDPVTPRSYVMQCAESDMGRILQSAFGWDTLVHGVANVQWDPPEFWECQHSRPRALFWCGVTAMRIKRDWHRRGILVPSVSEWCDLTVERCFNAAGV